MKHIPFKKIFSILALVSLTFALVGYNNVKMHGTFNDAMLAKFLKHVADKQSGFEHLKNYTFTFEKDQLKGPAVTNPGFFDRSTSESSVSKKASEWINHGGFSADEPEFAAGVRHFWEPFGGGATGGYLTDRGTYWEGIYNSEYTYNPTINAMQWALVHDENDWSMDKGMTKMELAFREEVYEIFSELMAKTYRSLGETMHLLADMGCPPHVRNDSHAAIVSWDYAYGFGDPDPYEDIVKPADVAKYNSLDTGGDTVKELVNQMRAENKPDKLFELMAKFTRKFFFSNDTITGVSQLSNLKIEPTNKKPLDSPLLESLRYDKTSGIYYMDFPNGSKIKLCKQKSWIWSNPKPHVDAECIRSQASVLFPVIVEAGANLIRQYIPVIEVKLTDMDSSFGTIQGTVKHITSDLYPDEIQLLNEVFLFVNGKPVDSTYVSYGEFSFREVNFKDTDEVYAEIRMPGFTIKSEVAESSAPSGFQPNSVTFELGVNQAIIKDSCGEVVSDYSWSLEDFAGETEDEGPSYTFIDDFIAKDVTLTITLNNSGDDKTATYTYLLDTETYSGCNDKIEIKGTVKQTDYYENNSRVQATYEALGLAACDAIDSITTSEGCDYECTPRTMQSYSCEQVIGGGIVRIIIYGTPEQ